MHVRVMPDMPVTEDGYTFKGCPQELLPMLKQMRRFSRPFLHWDPFKDTPPLQWPSPEEVKALNVSAGAQTSATASSHETSQGLRDPRVWNHVTGLQRPALQAAHEARELTDEEWVESFSSIVPVRQVVTGKLYLIQLATPEHGFRLGFAEAGARDTGGSEQHDARWFAKGGARGNWGDNPVFIPYMLPKPPARRCIDLISNDAFLLEVKEEWLTEACKAADPHKELKLKLDFVRRIRLLAKAHPIAYVATPLLRLTRKHPPLHRPLLLLLLLIIPLLRLVHDHKSVPPPL